MRDPHVAWPVFLAQRRRTAGIQYLLEGAGLDYLSSADYEGSPVRQLHDVISRCSAVVAYIDTTRPSVGVTLEIGAGLGRGLPVVLVFGARIPIGKLPPALRELPSMRRPDVDSYEGPDRLRSLIDSARSAAQAGPRPTRRLAGETGERDWPTESERRAATVLETLGAQIVGYHPANRRGKPDFAVWMPSLPGVPYNPVLVEVAGRLPKVKEKENQLRAYMSDSDALMGLLILPDASRPEWRILKGGAILVIGVDQLEEMNTEAFEVLLRDGRNRLFHAS